MEKTEKLVSTNQYLEAEKKWNTWLRNGETVSVLFAPVSDSRRRMTQFIENNKNSYCFVSIDLEDVAIEEILDLEKHIASQISERYDIREKGGLAAILKVLGNTGKKVVIAADLADGIFGYKGRHFLALFQKIYLQYQPNITFLFFFEMDITKSENLPLIKAYHILFQNIAYYPIYNFEDTLEFINYLCDKWNLKIPQKVKKDIFSKCGGYFWLVKEAVREIRDVGKWNVETEQFRYRIQTIAQSFSETEYFTVAKLLGKARGFDEKEIHSKNYLKKIGLIDDKGRLSVPLLEDEFIKLGANKRNLVLSGHEIFLNEVPVTRYFSRKELSIIKLFLSRKNELVSRDDVALAIWPINTDKFYSEWAIDQLIRRLRNRLNELLIPKTILRSVRGRGYIYG